MKNKIFLLGIFLVLIFLTGLQISKAQENRIILVDVNLDHGEASLGEVKSKLGFVPGDEVIYPDSPNIFWLELIALDGKSLERKQFSISNEVSAEPPIEGEEYIDSGDFIEDVTGYLVILPYYKNVKFIKLYSADFRLVDSKDISYLASTCGDGECQDHESFEDCPSDCISNGEDDFCNEEMRNTDPDCVQLVKSIDKKVEKENNTKNVSNIAFYIISVLVLLLIATGMGLFIWNKKQKNNFDN